MASVISGEISSIMPFFRRFDGISPLFRIVLPLVGIK